MFGINLCCFLYFVMGVCTSYIVIRIYDFICEILTEKKEKAEEQIKNNNRNNLFK